MRSRGSSVFEGEGFLSCSCPLLFSSWSAGGIALWSDCGWLSLTCVVGCVPSSMSVGDGSDERAIPWEGG